VIDGDRSSPGYGTLIETIPAGGTTFGVRVEARSGLVVVSRDSDDSAFVLPDVRPQIAH
jgi:hypothetical protein